MYEYLLKCLHKDLFEVSLHDIGEPLLADRIGDFIRAANSRHIGTSISSSLSVERPEAFWEELVDSGLDHLVVAIDGVTPQVYSQYRTNGNLALAFRNLARIVEARKRKGAKLRITWQMVDFPWNREEQEVARRMAAQLGCDSFRLIYDERPSRGEYVARRVLRKRNCLMGYVMFIVNAQGLVRPCCNLYQGVDAALSTANLLGPIQLGGFPEIWNGPGLQSIRSRKQIIQRDYCRYCQEM